MVSNARLLLPEPDSPVITINLSRGISTEIFFRLWTRAPCTAMVVRAPALAILLEVIPRLTQVDKCQFLQYHVAHLRELNRRGGLAYESLVGQVLARRGHPFHVEVALEMGLNLGGRSRFAHLAQVLQHRLEQRGRALRYVSVDRVRRRLHVLPRLLRIEHSPVHDVE